MTQPHEDMEEHRLRYLRNMADYAQRATYTPYSGFDVHAALETVDGFVVVGPSYYGGANIESAAFNPSIHAEQAALVSARLGWSGATSRAGRAPTDEPEAVCPQRFITAVYVRNRLAATPCGHCRQFLSEFVTQDCIWIVESTDGKILRSGMFADLLPEAFTGYSE